MRFTLRQVEAFAAVARTAHFGRAAEQLHLSQPTVSADLRGLERALGIELISRSRGGSRLTDAGQTVLPRALMLLEVAEELRVSAEGAPETVRLAVSPSILNRIVPDLMSRLAAQEPDEGAPLRLEIVKVGTGEVEDAVASGAAEAGIGHFLRARRGLRRTRLGDDELHVLSGRGVVTPGQPVQLREMEGRSLLLWPREQNPTYFDAINSLCTDRGIAPEMAGADPELGGAHSYLLRSGEAFSLVPADYAQEAPASLAAAPLDPPATLPLQLIHRAPESAGLVRIIHEVRHMRRPGRSDAP